MDGLIIRIRTHSLNACPSHPDNIPRSNRSRHPTSHPLSPPHHPCRVCVSPRTSHFSCLMSRVFSQLLISHACVQHSHYSALCPLVVSSLSHRGVCEDALTCGRVHI